MITHTFRSAIAAVFFATAATAFATDVAFNTATDVPITAASYTATGNLLNVTLNFAPPNGTNLTVVNNTGVAPISGVFSNVAQGQVVGLTYSGNGNTYNFVANYSGGTGNDLVLQSSSLVVNANFTSASTIPVTAASYSAAGSTLNLTLGYAPTVGTNLTIVKNTGLPFISGQFSNLTQGQVVNLTYSGVVYSFVANYYGGSGNDLVLQWGFQSLASWGFNGDGELGNNTTTNSSVPVAVTQSGVLAGKIVISTATGGFHSLALCSDGTVAAWGANGNGQLGNGTSANSSVPVAVTQSSGALAGKTVIALAAGQYCSMALCSDGTVAAWGQNNNGQLGNNSTIDSWVPVQVNNSGVLSGKTVVAVSAGYSYGLALCSDGTVAAWGGNTNGQLGNGTTTQSLVPVLVTQSGVLAGKTVVSVSAGSFYKSNTEYSHSLALCSDGTMASWGFNGHGELGNGTTTQSTTPVSVTRSVALASKTVVSVSAGYTHNLALCSDGTVWSWGANGAGELGNNTLASSTTPVQVITTSGISALYGKTVVSVATGQYHCLAVCSDGTMAAWGYNNDGELGNGNTTTPYKAPVLVTQQASGTLLNGKIVVSASAGGGNSLALAAAQNPANLTSLSGLTLSSGTLSPTFAGATTSYTATVSTSSITVTPTVATTSSTIKVNGTTVASGSASGAIPLVVGPNMITIIVTASDGINFKTYTVAVLNTGTYGVTYTSASYVPYTSQGFNTFGINLPITLGFAPPTGTNLTVVKNTGLGFIAGGPFSNLAQGAVIPLTYNGVTYNFVVNYYGGTGNDLVLQWAYQDLAAWGSNANGQLGNNSTTNSSVPVLATQSGVSGIPVLPTPSGALTAKYMVSVSAGSSHSVALCSDGTVVSWGLNNYGQLGNNTFTDSSVPVLVNTTSGTSALNGKTVVAVAAGYEHSLALCSDGSVVSWGYNGDGELGNNSTANSSVPVLVTNAGVLAGKTVISVAVGYEHSLALCSDGSVVSWGYNGSGQLGNNSSTNSSVPVLVTNTGVLAGKTVISVAAGQYHSLALCSDGSVAAWGANSNGQLGNNSATASWVPALVTQSGVLTGKTVVSVTAGYSHSLALCSDGTLATWGLNTNGQLGNNSTTQSLVPVLVNTTSGTSALYGKTVISVSGGYTFSLAGCSDGTLVAWGGNSNGQLGNNSTTQSLVPALVTKSGVLAGKTVVSVAAGNAHSLARCSDGTVASWGLNTNGQLGNNSTTQSLVPVLVTQTGVLAVKTLISVSAGSSHSLALCSDGTVAAWGKNNNGQLGNNSTTDSSVPVQVTNTGVLAGKTVVAVAAGSGHSLALCSDGTLAAWGFNGDGELGNNNSPTNSSVPVQVTNTGALAGKTVVSVAAGQFHNLALCSDGTVVAWGFNANGQLGNNSTTQSNVPVAVVQSGALAGKTVISLAAGGVHSLALCSDGTLTAWGADANGQLGNSGATDSSIPVLVTQSGVLAGKTVAYVAAGYYYSLALCADGTVAAWGDNTNGQLGNNSTTYSNVPVLVTQSGVLSGKTVTSVTAGQYHSLALCSDGTVAAWGSNVYGQLGNNSPTNSSVPVLVTQNGVIAGKTVVSAAAGYSHCLVLASVPNSPNLSGLTLSSGALSPSFDPATISYTGSVSNVVTSITVTPTSLANCASITVNGTSVVSGSVSQSVPLVMGTNAITIVVTAPDGSTTKTYTVTVSRRPALSGLVTSVGTLNPAFNPAISSYAVCVPAAVGSLTLTPTVADSTVRITVNGVTVTSGTASAPLSLSVGPNSITVLLTAKDGITTQSYPISVLRPAAINTTYTSAAMAPPVSFPCYDATGNSATLLLGFTPPPGTNLTVVKNTGSSFITGRFSNLAQGQVVTLAYSGVNYRFVVNYYGGTGNDLVLQWPYQDLAAWGDNGYNQLGNNSSANSSVPVMVTQSGVLAGKTLVSVSAGQFHTIALCADNTVVDWGYNYFGQLGNNSTTQSSVPVAVNTTSGTSALYGKTVVSVSAGQYHNLALCSDGTVAAWGNNFAGELGNNSTTNSSVPVPVTQSGVLAGKTVVSVAAGASHCLALCSDGTLASWGYNSNGQLGNGTRTTSTVPVLVTQSGVLLGKIVISIAAGQYHSIALCSDGTVVSWGYNTDGELGNGTTADSSVPVQVTNTGLLAGKSVVSVAPGFWHTLALCSDGTLASWGYNYTGQLGNNSTFYSSVPVQVLQGNGVLLGKTVVSIAAGSIHSLALCSDGTVASWGYNYSGQLGNNTTTQSNVPIPVTQSGLLSGKTVISVAGGYSHSLALSSVPNTPNLSGLALSSGTLSPSFIPATTAYSVTVPGGVLSLTVTPTSAANCASISVNGTSVTSGVASQAIPLVVGANTITTVVTAPDGQTTKTYTVTVTRLQPSSVCTLSGLTFDSGPLSPAFDAATTSYTASAPNGTSSVVVTPTATDITATIAVNGTTVVSGAASGAIPLSTGTNVITTVVTAEDGVTTKTYTVTVMVISNISSLSNLILSSGTLSPTFDPGTWDYTASVSNINSLTVTPTLTDATATMTVNGTSVASGAASGAIALSVGTNLITIVVTAQDTATQSTYTVTVTRLPSSVATLSGMALSSGTLSPSFSTGTTSYTAGVSNATSSITVTPIATDSTASITVNGTTVASGAASGAIALSVGTNTITTVVTAQDGVTQSTYTVTVTRAPSTVATLSGLVLSSGTLTPTFSAGTSSYTASVSNATTAITVRPTVTDSNATIKVNGTTVASGVASGAISLTVGPNTITTVVTAQDGTTQSTYTVTVTRNSNVATLSGLALSSGTLSPTFAAATVSYTATVLYATTSITVTPTVTDTNATVKVNGTTVASGTASGPIALTVGSNTITTVVTAQDGTTTKTYTVTVTRAAASTVATLSGLVLSSGTLTPTFAPATISYTASVPNATTSITVTPTVTDATSTVTVNGTTVTSGTASGAISLSVGANVITTVVTAQNGTTTKTYTVTVTRTSNISTLSALVLSVGTLSPAFASATTSYTASVPNATTSITVKPTVTDTTATIKVNGTTVASGVASGSISLSVGNNVITTVVTAQDGVTTTTYTLTVTRISNVATLSGLVLSSGTLSPTFAAATISYTASVTYATSSITVTPTVTDANATIKVNGTAVASGTASGAISLAVGTNAITTIVTAQDGTTTKTYTVTVTRAAASTVATLSGLVLSSGTLTPTFAAATIAYTASVTNATSSITVTPTVTDATATIKVNGTAVASGVASGAISLSVGTNTITTVVTAQDGVTTKTYTVTVTRAASTVATLSNLVLSAGTLSPTFASATIAYTATVPYASSSITVTPTVTDSTSTVKVNGTTVASGVASGAISLSVGTNTITTIVTAQDGTTTKTYTVTVTRSVASTVATLSGLVLSSGTLSPTFASATIAYAATVPYTSSSITVTPTATDTTATVKVNGTTVASGAASGAIALSVGTNTITTLATAQDGVTTKTYTVTVMRSAASTISTLSGLVPSSGTLSPTFAAATTSYTASVTNAISSITLTPTVTDATATVTVNGTTVASGAASGAISLSVGTNAITTIVTAQDSLTTKTYTVTVTRAASSNNTFASWIGTYPGLTDTTPLGDPDHDGIPNLLEYVLNGNPGVASRTILPTLSITTSNFIFTFNRLAPSAQDTTQIFEYSTNMSQWTDVMITTPTDSKVALGVTDSYGVQPVTVTIPRGTNTKIFGRLKVTQP